jgi:hypothetical protein
MVRFDVSTTLFLLTIKGDYGYNRNYTNVLSFLLKGQGQAGGIMVDLWIDEEVRKFGIDVPRWIEQDITCSDVAAILQGGCESGAYMPAVTYHQAIKTMEEYDKEILDMCLMYTIPVLPSVIEIGWYSLACWLVSYAVETWCASIEEELTEAIKRREDDYTVDDIWLCDDGTMDTVVGYCCRVCGKDHEIRYDGETACDYRDENTGALDEERFFTEVVIPDLDSMCPEED